MAEKNSNNAEFTFERFKWMILADAVAENVQHLWEPLWQLRGSYEIPGLSETERQEVAERALRELYADGLICLFREEKPGDVEDPAAVLSADEVEDVLKSDWWRGDPRDRPNDQPYVCWYATEKGESAYAEAPQEMRAHWERLFEDSFKASRKNRGMGTS